MQKMIVERQVIKNVSNELENMNSLLFQYLKKNYIWEEASILRSFNIETIRYRIVVSLKRRIFKKVHNRNK
jgi:hypothetical protein